MDLQRRVAVWSEQHARGLGVARVLFFGTGSSIALAVVPVTGSERPADLLGYALVWLVALCTYWYRKQALPALLATVLFMVTYWVLDYTGSAEPAAWLMFYGAARHGGHDRRRVWAFTSGGLVITTIVATVGVIVSTEDLPAIAPLGLFVLHGTFAAVGEATYQRGQYVEQLEQRAADLEADLENRAALAAVEERTRIAREMHDIIAHGMSTVVVQAQAARGVVDTNPSKAREALHTIEHIGRSSVEEMRRMLGVLRNDDGKIELSPQPGFDNLDELVHQVDVEEVSLELSVTGDLDLLPPGLNLTGYRILQEALTNVLRHAGRPVNVVASITYDDAQLSINVVDDGRGAGALEEDAGSRNGLRGMRERVDAYEGSLRSGAVPGGGFAVYAVLPVPAKVML